MLLLDCGLWSWYNAAAEGKSRMSNTEPQNDEVGGHSGPPYGDIKS
jgi:hypothetical protein